MCFQRHCNFLCFSSLGSRPSSPLPCALTYSSLSGQSLGSWLAVIEKGALVDSPPLPLSREDRYSAQSLSQPFCGEQLCFLILSTSLTFTHILSAFLPFDLPYSTGWFIKVPWFFIRVSFTFEGFSSHFN